MPAPEPPFPDDTPLGATLVPLRLVRVVLRERSDQQWIFLQEDDPDKDGNERGFPIVIGTQEASEIHRIVTGVDTPRPMTHQLMVGAIGALGSRVLGVDIVDLRSNTFYAQLRLAPSGGGETPLDEVLVDARPSDALAIALRIGAPIRVAESVLEEVRTDKSTDLLPDGEQPPLFEDTDPAPGHPGDGADEDEEGDGPDELHFDFGEDPPGDD